jgi:hypothetical protein
MVKVLDSIKALEWISRILNPNVLAAGVISFF